MHHAALFYLLCFSLPLLLKWLKIVLSVAVKALNDSGMEAGVRVYGHGSYKNKWPSPYAVACGALLALSFLKYVYIPLRWLAVVAIVVGIPPVVLKAFTAVRNCRLDINILVLITGRQISNHVSYEP